MFLRHHIHSIMSVRDAMLKFEDIIDLAKSNGEAFSITDHGSIAGWITINNLSKEHDFKPIYGIEAYINKNRDRLLEVVELIKTTTDKVDKARLQKERDSIKKYDHIVLLAKNQVGFYNIIKLANIAFVDGFYGKPTMTYDELFKHKEGIIVTSACLGGTVARHIMDKNIKLANEHISLMVENFGKDYYLELQFNKIKEQKLVNKKLLKFALANDIPMCVGSDAHYKDLASKETHQDLLMLQSRSKRKDIGKIDYQIEFENSKGEVKTKKVSPHKEFRKGVLAKDVSVGDKIGKDIILSIKEVNRVWSFSGDAAYMSETELKEYATEHHDEVDPKHFDKIFGGNYEIYDKIEAVEFNTDIKLPTIENAKKKLTALVKEGLIRHKFANKKEYVARVKRELKVIKDNGFATYFLILADFIKYATDHSIPMGAGRGSGVRSLVAFLLGIHRVNPLEDRWGDMPFERFLSGSRTVNKIIVFDEDNNKKEFTSNDRIEIVRDDNELEIFAGELIEGDEFVKVLYRSVA